MKNLITFFTFLAFCTNANATIHTVSNNPIGSAQFNDVQSAINASSAGDTIYIAGSGVGYNLSGIILSMPLVLIGTGYADSSEGHLNSMIYGNITLDSIATPSSSGSQFIGIVCNGTIVSNTVSFNAKNIFLSGCLFNDIYISNDGWIVENCVVPQITFGFPTFSINSCIIENNFIMNINQYYGGNLPSGGLLIDHNIIESDISNYGYFITDATITNNIFFYANANQSGLASCTINNNLFYGSNRDSIPVGCCGNQNTENNNYITVAPNYQFNNTATAAQNFPGLLGYSWQLLATSLGHNAATDGTDCGVYGGNYPMNFEGSNIPPQMFQLNISNMILPVNGILNVQFEAKQQKQ